MLVGVCDAVVVADLVLWPAVLREERGRRMSASLSERILLLGRGKACLWFVEWAGGLVGLLLLPVCISWPWWRT